jgi:hypothetical protein
MTIRKSVMMLSNTGTNWNKIGEPVRGDAYWGYTDGLHTIQIIFQNFVGGVGIQATLALNPEPNDWFWIKINPQGDTNSPYLTFPIDPLAPTGANGGDTGSIATTFIGNFVFLRVVMTRDYIQPSPVPSQLVWNTWQWGQIDKVLLSL